MAVPKTTDRDALEHIAEAYANYRRYERFLNNPEEVSWAVVALFYSAVHLMAGVCPRQNANEYAGYARKARCTSPIR